MLSTYMTHTMWCAEGSKSMPENTMTLSDCLYPLSVKRTREPSVTLILLDRGTSIVLQIYLQRHGLVRFKVWCKILSKKLKARGSGSMAFENRTLAFLSSVFVTMTPSAVLPLMTTEARPVHPINDAAMYTFGGLMLTAGTVAIAGNIMVMYTFLSKSTLRKSAANIYTINLAFANTWLGIFGSVISFHIFQGKYATTAHCQAEGFFVSGIHITVIMTITCMIADRFHVICGKKTFCKVAHERPKVIVVITWIYSFLWSAPPLTTLVPEYIEEPLIPSCIFDRFTNSLSNRLYIITMCTFVFFIPLVFICYCLYRIIWAVKSSSVLLAKYQVSNFAIPLFLFYIWVRLYSAYF
ncbi:melanopsin-A-like [Ciona intestinalis]